MKFQDYYKILGVERTATQEEIQKSFRKLARKCHPDLNKEKSAEEKFKKLNEAYEVLRDPEKRSRYDQLGEHWQAGQDFKAPPGWEQFFGAGAGSGPGQQTGPGPQSKRGGQARQQPGGGFSFGMGGFSDFFETLFGGRGGSAQSDQMQGASQRMFSQESRPEQFEADMNLTIEELVRGGKKNISLNFSRYNAQGKMEQETKTFTVKIPRGVSQGSKVRLSSKRPRGVGESLPGDLLLKVRIAPHSRYRIQEHDLIATLVISPWEAALGTKADMQTPEGVITLTVPAGSQSGQQLRVKGRGLPKKGDERGNLLVEIKIGVPKQLSTEERELFVKLAEVSQYRPRL